jgi:hypothetical protein
MIRVLLRPPKVRVSVPLNRGVRSDEPERVPKITVLSRSV